MCCWDSILDVGTDKILPRSPPIDSYLLLIMGLTCLGCLTGLYSPPSLGGCGGWSVAYWAGPGDAAWGAASGAAGAGPVGPHPSW